MCIAQPDLSGLSEHTKQAYPAQVMMEKKFLQEELDLLNNAIPIQNAANELMTYVGKEQEPMQNPGHAISHYYRAISHHYRNWNHGSFRAAVNLDFFFILCFILNRQRY